MILHNLGVKAMLLWIESQNTAVIALLGFGFCYVLAALIFGAAVGVSRRSIAVDLKATSPVMLTPLSVIAALLIAFLASRVWANLDHANTNIAQEASALRESVLLADAMPVEVRTAVRNAVKTYLQFVEMEDWPAMAEGRASLRESPPGLADALASFSSFVPAGPGPQLAQQRAVVAVERALEARWNRILLSKATIAPIQWLVVVILAALTLVTIAMVHIERRTTVAINLFIFSTAVGACLVLLMVNDRPFAIGGITIEPSALRDINID
jgi:Protein of unknown function (DUF4239)